MSRKRPIVGVIGNTAMLNETYPVHAGGVMNTSAIADVAGAMPLLVPADPRFVSVDELLETCDGFLLTGGRPNVHPEEYGEAATEAVDLARGAQRLDLGQRARERLAGQA